MKRFAKKRHAYWKKTKKLISKLELKKINKGRKIKLTEKEILWGRKLLTHPVPDLIYSPKRFIFPAVTLTLKPY